jgi:hypothetical protein
MFGGMCVEGEADQADTLRCELTRNRLEAHSSFAHIGLSLRTLFVYGMGRSWYVL